MELVTHSSSVEIGRFHDCNILIKNSTLSFGQELVLCSNSLSLEHSQNLFVSVFMGWVAFNFYESSL